MSTQVQTKYPFPLETHPKLKGTCPNCEQKKAFRHFEGLPREFGICDKKNTCGHINIPGKEVSTSLENIPDPLPKVKTIFPDQEQCKNIIADQSSTFHKFVIDKLKITSEHLSKWNCGTTHTNQTCYIYQNIEQVFLNMVHIEYKVIGNNEDCKRNKEKFPYSLKPTVNGKYSLCLFGSHLLSQDKTICLIEGEKAAIICSFFYPQYDWIATGGANKLTDEKISVLFNRKIYYLADSDQAGRQNSTIKKLLAYKLDFTTVDLFPDRNDGYDLADAVIKGDNPAEIIPKESIVSSKTKPKGNIKETKKIDLFYQPKYSTDEETGEKYIKDIVINYTAWIELLYSFGFRRFDIDKNFVFVKLEKRVIKQVTITQIQDYFINYLKSLPNELGKGLKSKMIIDKFYKNPAYYFCHNRLSLLTPNEPITFNTDTKNESFIYFKNGFVKVNKDAWKLFDYTKLTGYIWEDQILDRDFSAIDYHLDSELEMPVFGKFVFNISGKDSQRFNSLCTIAGYNLHSYFETTLKATILTDSEISEDAEGRTGKTLFTKSLGQLKRYVEIAGKNFKFDDKYKYSTCSLDTQIVHINDARKYIDFENFYNDITEGITVERKNQHPFTVMVKMIISTNKTIKIDGGSSRDRSIEFELANHYNDKHKPEDEFGHWFFRDWESVEWNKFDNFLIFCIWSYFKHGIIAPNQINLDKRKLLDHTCPEFIEFIEQESLPFNEKIDRTVLHEKFLNAFSDIKTDKYKNQLKFFTKCLVHYAKYTKGFAEINKKTDLFRHNNINWIIFKKE
ncbi:MAG: DUF6371 domain-containing protein [Bacteroidota bacterium]|nr:DUF6371 domain-containing protein [Bacteroidota bacterium]